MSRRWGIVPAAGLGTRIQPLAFSKELLPVGTRHDGGTERPRAVCEYLLERMILGGATHVCFVISPGKTDIMSYFGGRLQNASICYAIQQSPAGLCDAVFGALPFISPEDEVLVGLPDTIWFPIEGYTFLPDRRLSFLLFPVAQPELFDAVITDENGSVQEIQVKQSDAKSQWVWGAFKLSGEHLDSLYRLWQRRGRSDQYFGTLVNAYLGERAPRSGSSAVTNMSTSELCTAIARPFESCQPLNSPAMRWSVNRFWVSGWSKLVKSRTLGAGVRPLIFAAHPDDETLGASVIMMRCPQTIVVYLTDGAPRDRSLRSPDAIGSREKYVRTRLREASSALQLARVERDRMIFLGSVDQEAIFQIVPRALYFASLLERFRPDVVITHAYEGGHPDHDAAALIARLALDALRYTGVPLPDLVEMTSYHASAGGLVTGLFLDGDSSSSMVIELSPREIERKRAMMNAYGSQWRVLQSFGVNSEMLRIAPAYDFRRPPHHGKLWYECLGWKMTGSRWRSLAADAISEMEQRCA